MAVVVTIVDGGEALTRCLQALRSQESAPRLDVIVPYDATVDLVGALAAQFPEMRFLNLGALAAVAPRNEFEQHALYDRRRAAGLKAAQAPIVAIIEDRGAPRSNWARAMVDAHARFADAAIGGSIENDATDPALWAIFFLDFGRYQAPFDTETPEYVTDTNISYKRTALQAVEHLWVDRYQEPIVNWALREKGFTLRLTAEPRTAQKRSPIGVIAMASERFHWGRLYAMLRCRGRTRLERLKWASLTPLLPPGLFLRNLRRQLRLRRRRTAFALATPVMIYLLVCWSIGEFAGYLTGDRHAPDGS